jgi:hypothetical protein
MGEFTAKAQKGAQRMIKRCFSFPYFTNHNVYSVYFHMVEVDRILSGEYRGCSQRFAVEVDRTLVLVYH